MATIIRLAYRSISNYENRWGKTKFNDFINSMVRMYKGISQANFSSPYIMDSKAESIVDSLPLTTPKVNEQIRNMNDNIGIILSEKLLGKRCPVTLRSTACGIAVSKRITTTNTASSMTTVHSPAFSRYNSLRLDKSFLTVCSNPLLTKAPPPMSRRIMSMRMLLLRSSEKCPKNQRNPSLPSRERTIRSGMAADSNHDIMMRTT